MTHPHTGNPGSPAELELVRRALAGEYEVLEELGRGGMAVVYRARDRQLDREVALKVLPPALVLDSAYVERFQREGRIAAQLEHPHIVPIYRVGRQGDVIYFAMKHLRGGSLASLLKRQGRLAPAEVRRILLEVGDALACAASGHIVHRDIKPENILFDEAGRCVVTDFGIAKSAADSQLTGTGQSIGTPHYMSPEQARGAGTDGRSDLYSLGVVAYHCLAGKVPFDGSDNMAILYAHVHQPLPRPELPTAEHESVYRIIERLVSKGPADRVQSGEELVAILRAGPAGATATIPVQSLAASGSGPGRFGEAWRKAKRYPRAWGISAVVAAVLLITAYGWSSPAFSDSLCPAQADFLLLMDPVPAPSAGSKLRIAYDVCGLPKGTPYRGRLRLTKREDFFKKMFDQAKPVVVTFEDRVKGPATRRRRSLDLGASKPGSYTLELSVTDNRGRERKRSQPISVRPD